MGTCTERFLALPDTGSVEEDLRQVLRGLTRLLSTSQGRTLLRIAVLPDDPERADARQAYWVKRLARIEVLIRRGIDRGELRADTDPRLALEMLVSPVQAKVLIYGEPLTDDLPDRLVESVLRGIRA
ncbi:TetR-like C-terminal domain-containing protein [Streptomyces sp. NPDC047061]|uniref:TetR-like C-terminal domain-containing protein n=1 Tax=Streptomyces sp. NPDC047061 TaxID=3154605 RepID=UPI0033D8AD99